MNISSLILFTVTSIMSVTSSFNLSDILYLNTPEGTQRLVNAKYQQSYWQLSIYYDTQKEPTFCGVASSIMVLNALGIDRPPWRDKSAFKLYMQEHFFTPEVEKIVTREKAATDGIDLPELRDALKTFGVNVTMISGAHLSLNQFRSILVDNLKSSNKYIIVNYFRPSVKQTGKGHFSPVAAYDEETDSVLVMDVARYRYPPAWIPVSMLYDSIVALDEDTGYTRGLLIVSKE